MSRNRISPWRAVGPGMLCLLAASAAQAQGTPPDAAPADAPAAAAAETVALHAQTTWVRQLKPALQARYSGPHSLVPERESSYSYTATADLGVRLWSGAQLHYNPEVAQGVPLSGLQGLGGVSNGELARTGGPTLRGYNARAYLEQVWSAGGAAQEPRSAAFNSLAGTLPERRWVARVGVFSLLDYFDNNPYAKDPRTQAMNWSFLTHGAWDYAADARGYSRGAMLEYHTPAWSMRAARTMVPRESNGLALDEALGTRYGDQIELESELPLALPAGPLRVSVLGFRNRAVMGGYRDALAAAGGGVPDVGAVRRLQNKTGWGVTLLAPLADDAGLFVRLSRNDGGTETYSFTEIDRQLAVGAQFTGAAWGRPADRWGVALALNNLSAAHRDYLAAGGLGYFLGDGALRYGAERVSEVWYRLALPTTKLAGRTLESALTLGAQSIDRPGYNRDRGPARVYSLRLHAEF